MAGIGITSDCICGHPAGEHSFIHPGECMVVGCGCDGYMTEEMALATHGNDTVSLSPEQREAMGFSSRAPEPEQSTASSEPDTEATPEPAPDSPTLPTGETTEQRDARLMESAMKYGLEIPQPPQFVPTWWNVLPFRGWLRTLVGLAADVKAGEYFEKLMLNNMKAQQVIIVRTRQDVTELAAYANSLATRLNELIAELAAEKKKIAYYEVDSPTLTYSRDRYLKQLTKEAEEAERKRKVEQDEFDAKVKQQKLDATAKQEKLTSRHNDGILKLEQ